MQDDLQRSERVLMSLLIEIARGNIGGDRFNQLLLETGVYLDDIEWEYANRLLGRSDQLLFMAGDVSAGAQ